ncbi:MAG: fumarylacetoacetate hydrolase family protein [Acidobacteriota bacterium]
MKLIRFDHRHHRDVGILIGDRIAPVIAINAKFGLQIANDILAIIQAGAADQLKPLHADHFPGVETIPLTEVQPLVPYDVPPKIWCIGLNYRTHADDIDAIQPDEPGSFMKPASCMIHPGGEILLPPSSVSEDVDAEGELGVVIGKQCKGISLEEVPDMIFGYTTTLDLTALDVLRRNPRYLTRAKSYDTFFSFGPVIVTADEIANVDQLEVITEHNGGICSRDFVHHMRHLPYELVRFHAQAMTLYPGDLISTGCPKGARIKAGDRVAARIDGVGRLEATVRVN